MIYVVREAVKKQGCLDLPFPRVSSLQCLGVGALVGALLTLHEKLISAICSHCLNF